MVSPTPAREVMTVAAQWRPAYLLVEFCLALIVTQGTAVAFRAASDGSAVRVGVAQVDITPDYSVRLSGFGFRRTESEGITQRIWAKALAFGDDDRGPAALITVDNLGVPDYMVEELAGRLKKAGITRDRLAVTATHTHTAPMLKNVAPTLFGMPIPAEHQDQIDRYTHDLTDKLEQVALAALADRKPAKLECTIGRATFATNRRTKDGPVDHDLPVLIVRDTAGKLRAVYTSYACHCVTLSNNKISGDWAGFAQEAIQREFPGAVALVSVGCGADSNPTSGVTGDRVDVAEAQGEEIAAAVKQLVSGTLRPVTGEITARWQRIELALQTRTREEWEQRAKSDGAVGYHAQVNLGRLDRGESLKSRVSYPIQTWAFGRDLAMVFLPGEVVVDYSLRLKRELDGSRLWINAYSNDDPCYIPSERVLSEGGYEGGDAMVYYDLPNRFEPGLEQKIVDTVHAQLDADFKPPVDTSRTQGVRPLSAPESLAAMRVRAGFTVELVAAEPLVVDPVAIDFGPDGRLWVCEMYDYPTGLDGNFQPGGRIKLLEDTDGDGRYDTATVFLDKIPFPTGITVWRRGVLVCAAPDILYAEDTNGDGKADVVEKIFSGFATHNYQARVNSLTYGLDGWVYGSCGIFGGEITSLRGGLPPVHLVGRDFRMKPDTGQIEPVIGQTQQGRVRDDWGNWFGCDNSTLLRHYPVDDTYIRRNPHVAPPGSAMFVPGGQDPNRLYGISQPVLFPLSGPSNRVTAACGLGIYRDQLLGSEYTGDTFTCEPVGNLVHHLRLKSRGVTFTGERPAGEEHAEFLASTDSWFRPVQATTGPDGALWIVDMYRYVIEHPRWIPPEILTKLDVRAGDTMGRIYRVYPEGRSPRPIPRLDPLDAAGLVAALDSSNGWQRDMAQQMLVWRNDKAAVPALEQLIRSASRPEARLHALCTLDELGGLEPRHVALALADAYPGVRRHAIRLAERLLPDAPELGDAVLQLADDSDPQVQLQLAYSLGQWRDGRAARALGKLALKHAHEPYLMSAVLSSVGHENLDDVLAAVLSGADETGGMEQAVEPLLGLAAAMGDERTLARVVELVTKLRPGQRSEGQIRLLGAVLDSMDRRRTPLEKVAAGPTRDRVQNVLANARRIAAESAAAESDRIAAVRVLGRVAGVFEQDLDALAQLLSPQTPTGMATAAVEALGRTNNDRALELLLSGWSSHTPALRAQILDVLLSRDSGVRAIMQSIERGAIATTQIDATRRQRLLQHENESLRARAEQVFAGATDSDRQQVVDNYKDIASLTGEPMRGKAVFAKSCAPCHKLADVGYSVGPDLAALPDRSPQALLVSILDPSRAVDQRYVQYIIATNDGRVFTGMLAAETSSSVTLRGQESKEQIILRNTIDELRGTGKSLMPDGLERDLSREELADLIAYIGSIGPTAKSLAGNAPQTVRPDKNGSLALLATNCEIYGGDIVFEQPFQNIGYWHGEHDHVAWTIELAGDGAYDLYLDWACHPDAAGNTYVIEGSDQPPLRRTVESTGGWDQYHQRKIGTVQLGAGSHRLVFRPDGKLTRPALLDLRGVWLVPTGETPNFPALRSNTIAAAFSGHEAAESVSERILNAAVSDQVRSAMIESRPDIPAELIAAMTRELPDDRKEEYRRIPWIWRIAIAAGKRNDAGQIKRVLEVALPECGQPLRDWQAVVLGGGVINGVSRLGMWPGNRVAEILKGDAELTARWQRAVDLASSMADNDTIPSGTRYDALRILGVEPWERHGEQLVKYLAKGTNDELQMGAISALADMNSPLVGPAIIANIRHYPAQNRELALDALLRDESRIAALLDGLATGLIQRNDVSAACQKKLMQHSNVKLRARARELLE